MFSSQNVWPIKRKAVYTLVLDWIGSQLAYFLKTTYLILVNHQAVAGSKKKNSPISDA